MNKQNKTPQRNRQLPVKRKWILLGAISIFILTLKPESSLSKHTYAKPSDSGHRRLLIEACHDGDTCSGLDSTLKKFKLRLIGVDAPELSTVHKKGQIYAEEAKKFLELQVKGKKISVHILGLDIYHRFLVILNPERSTHEFKSINQLLIEEGYAYAYSGKTQNSEILKWSFKAQSQAQKMKKGLWSLKIRPEDPRLFRARSALSIGPPFKNLGPSKKETTTEERW